MSGIGNREPFLSIFRMAIRMGLGGRSDPRRIAKAQMRIKPAGRAGGFFILPASASAFPNANLCATD